MDLNKDGNSGNNTRNPLVELSQEDDESNRMQQREQPTEEETHIPLSLFTSLFKKKFEKFEQRLDVLASNSSTKTMPAFKYRGNELQYKHNTEVARCIHEALTEAKNPAGDREACYDKLNEALDLITERNRHIKIADSTSGGWSTVDELIGNQGIAANSEEEKKIREANARAVEKKKEKKKTSGWSNQFRNASQFRDTKTEEELARRGNYSGDDGRSHGSYTSSSHRLDESSSQRFPRYERYQGKDYSKPYIRGQCYSCGSRSHWRRDCPYLANREQKETGKRY